ncbi:unnamed protein product, partial [Cladocopium goreaui]
CYLRVQLTFAGQEEMPSATILEASIQEALQSHFGSCGASKCQWSLLSPPAESGLFLLKTTTPEHLQQLRAALTLLTRIQRRRCRMDVLAVAPSLAALACKR